MDKIDFIKALNEIILGLGDEDIIDAWICIMPDCPTEEDFEFIANNQESFDEVVNEFVRLSKHIKTGIKVYGKWYMGK